MVQNENQERIENNLINEDYENNRNKENNENKDKKEDKNEKVTSNLEKNDKNKDIIKIKENENIIKNEEINLNEEIKESEKQNKNTKSENSINNLKNKNEEKININIDEIESEKKNENEDIIGNNQEGNVINLENKNESIISNEKEKDGKDEDNSLNHSEEYKDYSNEEKEKEEEMEEKENENNMKKEDDIIKNKVNENKKETPSRKKNVEPHASPTFNVYGNSYNTPMPLSSKDTVEVIIEKPKEDEEREDDLCSKEKEKEKEDNSINVNDKNKLITNDKFNNNENNNKLIYTHLKPEIIDNTINTMNNDNIYQDKDKNKDLMQSNNSKKEEIKIKQFNSDSNKDNKIDNELEEEEIEEEEEEEDDNEEEENEEKEKKENKNNNNNNNNESNSNINNNNKNNISDNSYKNSSTKEKLMDNSNNDKNKSINDDNKNHQINQKIIEYENKNQYTYPNIQLFKNNFTYIKKNTIGNSSFRSFNRSLKNKISMNNSLNNNTNTQQTLSNHSERKIIGIYSKPNNYIENLERERERNEEKIIENEEKFEKTPKISRFNKMKIGRNINNLGNEYLYKYKKNKKEITQSENDEYEDYEVSSSENDHTANEANNNNNKSNMIYNKKIFLMKKEKEKPKNINIISNDEKEINKIGVENNIKKGNYLNNNENKSGEEESEEESYEIEESEEEYNEDEEEEEDSNQGEIIEEKRQFKKKDKKKLDSGSTGSNNYSYTSDNIDINEDNNDSNDLKIEATENSNIKEEIGVEPENESEKILLLELDDNGLPILKENEILICNVNSVINISVPRGKEISNEIALISNCEKDFPDPFYLNEIIEENKKNNLKDKYDKINLKLNLNSSYDNNQIKIKKELKPYQIYPNKINSKIYFRITCKKTGNISFLIMYKDSTQNNKIKFTKPFYILVNPFLNIKSNNPIEVNQIQMQSILSHKIGHLSTDFESYYEEASLLGYNFLHFRTLQKLSKENDIYLIKDQHDLNDAFFLEKEKKRNNKLRKYQQLSNIIQNLGYKYKIGCITDVVLHQTSSESEWIFEHSECGYTLENTPWLNVSYELDKILVNYSNLFYQKKVRCDSAPYINDMNDINDIMEEIKEEITRNKLEEFFYVSLEKYFVNFKNYYQKILKNLKNQNVINKLSMLINELKIAFKTQNNIRNIININSRNSLSGIILKTCTNYGYKRYGVEINVEFLSLLIISLYHLEKKGIPTEYYFLKEIKTYIENINNIWKDKIKGLIDIALLNIKEYLRYKYLQLNNKNKIKNLIESYFYINNKKNSKKINIFLCNGWVMNSHAETFI